MFDILQVMGRPEPEKRVPAHITCCARWPEVSEGRVRRYAATALYVTEHANRRFNDLFSRDLEGRWDDPMSPERYWFGAFSRLKADKVRRTFQGIARHLSNPDLKIICDDGLVDSYAKAMPGIPRITLGTLWRTPERDVDPDAERVQTFVHEAAHICGRTSGLAESNFYGRAGAHILTRWRMRATRNADNYGYYAVDLVDWASRAILS
jgi:hypothetical protein